MFHRVRIIEEDGSVQLSQWSGIQTNKNSGSYCMKAVISESYLCHLQHILLRTKNTTLFKQKTPGIIRAMEKQHYVDDYLQLLSTEDETICRTHAIIDIHSHAGFEMEMWMSNSSMVTQINQHQSFGLSWFPNTDFFLFTPNLKVNPSEISSGLIQPSEKSRTNTDQFQDIHAKYLEK